jgi:hypothetical protein
MAGTTLRWYHAVLSAARKLKVAAADDVPGARDVSTSQRGATS